MLASTPHSGTSVLIIIIKRAFFIRGVPPSQHPPRSTAAQGECCGTCASRLLPPQPPKNPVRDSGLGSGTHTSRPLLPTPSAPSPAHSQQQCRRSAHSGLQEPQEGAPGAVAARMGGGWCWRGTEAPCGAAEVLRLSQSGLLRSSPPWGVRSNDADQRGPPPSPLLATASHPKRLDRPSLPEIFAWSSCLSFSID